MRKKIFIAGGGGMLGEGFYQVFKDEYDLAITDIDVNETWISYLDFRNIDEYRKQVKEYNPDYLFHLGAHTSLEYCDTHQDDAYETNTIAVENAVHISNELNIPLLYISTAGIFIVLFERSKYFRYGYIHGFEAVRSYGYFILL